MSILKIKGIVQNYTWGGKEFLPKLLNKPFDSGHFAEYWLGAHDNAPSFIPAVGKKLNEFISSNPEELLGNNVFNQFGRLPFLFKVLDVHEMLSIQVHPSKIDAEKGFARENAMGIPISAAHRNYKDDNHKPEIMVALGEFWLLHGFLSKRLLLHNLTSVPELSRLIPFFELGGYKGLYQHVMEESDEETNRTLQPIVDRIMPLYDAGKIEKSSADFWAARAYKTFCKKGKIDKGIYSIYFFNVVMVSPGHAIFQDAGVPHAYLEGQNMELMANSDNVLRGGLTQKHVDVPELMRHINFEETVPNILNGQLQSDGIETVFKSPARDFELSELKVGTGDVYENTSDTMEILIVLKGAICISGSETIRLNRGESVLLTSGSHYYIEAEINSTVYKARCPY